MPAHPFIRLARFLILSAVRRRKKVSAGEEEEAEDDGSEVEDGADGQEVDRRASKDSRASRNSSKGRPKMRAEFIPDMNVVDSDEEVASESTEQNMEIEELYPEDYELLAQTMRNMHKGYKDVSELVVDEHIQKGIQAMRNPMLKYNGLFVMADQSRLVTAPKIVPKVVIVTGFNGEGGNSGVNGIYELYPDQYNRRPVYQKMLEKRSIALAADAWTAPPPPVTFRLDSKGRPVEEPAPAAPEEKDWSVRRDQVLEIVHGCEQDDGRPKKMVEPASKYFLFFEDELGCWCIAPTVGGGRFYARCPGSGDLVPISLNEWEVWDIGRREWRRHTSMKAFKGGHCKASLGS